MAASSTHFDREDIDVALVERLISAQFPQWADLPISPAVPQGWDNKTFRLGAEMSVRLPSAAPYALQVEKEHRWLPELAPHLPLPIPVPLAKGAPAEGYPFTWSVYRWLEGETASTERVDDLIEFATTLADFLAALQRIDPAGGPPPGRHNFFRGGPLTVYDAETRQAIAALNDKIDTDAATAVWEAALAAKWHGPTVWVHGDVAAGNLLVEGGRLSAVIDFGTSGVGDPSCDLAIAWTLFGGESRDAFRAALGLDDATWARGRGWVLWKCLITLAAHIDTNPPKQEGSDAKSMTSSPITSTAHDTRRRVADPVRHRMSDVFEPLAALLPPLNIATPGDLTTQLLSVQVASIRCGSCSHSPLRAATTTRGPGRNIPHVP